MELPAFMSQQQAEDALHVYLRLGGISEYNIEQACILLTVCKQQTYKQEQLIALFKDHKCKSLNTSGKSDTCHGHDTLISPEEWLLLVSSLTKDANEEHNVRATNTESTVLHLSSSSTSSHSEERWEKEERSEESSLLLVETHTPSKVNETAKRESEECKIEMPLSPHLVQSNTFHSINSDNDNINNTSKNCNSMSSLVSCVNNKYITENTDSVPLEEKHNNLSNKKINNQMLNLFIACGARQIFVPHLRQREWRLTPLQWRRRVEELCLLLNCKLPPVPITDEVATVICENEERSNENRNNCKVDNAEQFITLQRFTAAIKAELATCSSCVKSIECDTPSCYSVHQQDTFKHKHIERRKEHSHELMLEIKQDGVESVLACMREGTLPCWLCTLSCIAERELEEFAGALIARFVRSLLCVQCVLVVLLERKHEHVHALRKLIRLQTKKVHEKRNKDNKHISNNNKKSEQPVNGHNIHIPRDGESCLSITSSTRPFLYEEEEQYHNLKDYDDSNENAKDKLSKPRYMESKPLDELSQSIVARTRARRLFETLRKSTIPINRLEGFAQLEADEPTDFAQNLLEEWQNSSKAGKQPKHTKTKHSTHKEIKNNKEMNRAHRCSSLETQLEPSVRTGNFKNASRSPNPSYNQPATMNKNAENEFYISSSSSSSSYLESESSSSYDSDAMLPAQMLFSRPPLHNNTCKQLKRHNYKENTANSNSNNVLQHQQQEIVKGVNAKQYKNMPQSLLCPRRAVPAGVMFKVNASLPASHHKQHQHKQPQICSANGTFNRSNKRKTNSTFERLSRPTVDVRWFQSSRVNSYSGNDNTDNHFEENFLSKGKDNNNNCYSSANTQQREECFASTTKETSTRSQTTRATSTPQPHAQRPQSAMDYMFTSLHAHLRAATQTPAQLTSITSSSALQLPHQTETTPLSQEYESSREITSACLPKSNNKNMIKHSKYWNSSNDSNNVDTSHSTRHSSVPPKKPIVEQYLEKVEASLREDTLLHVQSLLQELRSEPRERTNNGTYNNKNSAYNTNTSNSVNNAKNKVHTNKTKRTNPAKCNSAKSHKINSNTKMKREDSNLNTTLTTTVPGKESYSTRSRNLIKSISQIYGAN